MVHSCVDTKMATIPPAGKERGKETKKDNVLVCIFKNSSTSIGSTSCAMATSTALFCSMSLVMLCMPYFTAIIFFTAGSWPPFALVLARLRNLSRFWAFDSGRYLWKNLNSCVTRERERARPAPTSTPSLTSRLLQCICELIDGGRDLQSLVEDTSLTLYANVARPFHKSSQITLRLNVTTLIAIKDVNVNNIHTYLCHSCVFFSQWEGSSASSSWPSLPWLCMGLGLPFWPL